MKKIYIFLFLLVAIFIVAGIFFYLKYFQGVKPVIFPSPFVFPDPRVVGEVIVNKENDATSSLPLLLPKGFSIEVFAKDIPGARALTFDQSGNLWVSQTKKGKISPIEI